MKEMDTKTEQASDTEPAQEQVNEEEVLQTTTDEKSDRLKTLCSVIEEGLTPSFEQIDTKLKDKNGECLSDMADKNDSEKIQCLLDTNTGISSLIEVGKEIEIDNKLVETLEELLKLKCESNDDEEKQQGTEEKQNNENTVNEETKPQAEPLIPYTSVLESSLGTFIDCLHPTTNLLDFLVKNSVLSPDMYTKIMCRPNRPDKVRILMAFMMTLGPKSLTLFIDGLRKTEQLFLANILDANEFT